MLHGYQQAAHFRHGGNGRSGIAHLGQADIPAHVLAVDQYPTAGGRRLQTDIVVADQSGEPLRVVKGHPLLYSQQGHGAVHSAGIDIKISQPVGHDLGHSGFAGSGRTVDSDLRCCHMTSPSSRPATARWATAMATSSRWIMPMAKNTATHRCSPQRATPILPPKFSPT